MSAPSGEKHTHRTVSFGAFPPFNVNSRVPNSTRHTVTMPLVPHVAILLSSGEKSHQYDPRVKSTNKLGSSTFNLVTISPVMLLRNSIVPSNRATATNSPSCEIVAYSML